MLIDQTLISYLEDLSCLTLSAEEKQRISGDLKEILGYMERLGALSAEGVAERSHPFDHVNAFREDEVGASLDRDLILQNAPRGDGKMFVAPGPWLRGGEAIEGDEEEEK